MVRIMYGILPLNSMSKNVKFPTTSVHSTNITTLNHWKYIGQLIIHNHKSPWSENEVIKRSCTKYLKTSILIYYLVNEWSICIKLQFVISVVSLEIHFSLEKLHESDVRTIKTSLPIPASFLECEWHDVGYPNTEGFSKIWSWVLLTDRWLENRRTFPHRWTEKLLIACEYSRWAIMYGRQNSSCPPTS